MISETSELSCAEYSPKLGLARQKLLAFYEDTLLETSGFRRESLTDIQAVMAVWDSEKPHTVTNAVELHNVLARLHRLHQFVPGVGCPNWQAYLRLLAPLGPGLFAQRFPTQKLVMKACGWAKTALNEPTPNEAVDGVLCEFFWDTEMQAGQLSQIAVYCPRFGLLFWRFIKPSRQIGAEAEEYREEMQAVSPELMEKYGVSLDDSLHDLRLWVEELCPSNPEGKVRWVPSLISHGERDFKALCAEAKTWSSGWCFIDSMNLWKDSRGTGRKGTGLDNLLKESKNVLERKGPHSAIIDCVFLAQLWFSLRQSVIDGPESLQRWQMHVKVRSIYPNNKDGKLTLSAPTLPFTHVNHVIMRTNSARMCPKHNQTTNVMVSLYSEIHPDMQKRHQELATHMQHVIDQTKPGTLPASLETLWLTYDNLPHLPAPLPPTQVRAHLELQLQTSQRFVHHYLDKDEKYGHAKQIYDAQVQGLMVQYPDLKQQIAGWDQQFQNVISMTVEYVKTHLQVNNRYWNAIALHAEALPKAARSSDMALHIEAYQTKLQTRAAVVLDELVMGSFGRAIQQIQALTHSRAPQQEEKALWGEQQAPHPSVAAGPTPSTQNKRKLVEASATPVLKKSKTEGNEGIGQGIEYCKQFIKKVEEKPLVPQGSDPVIDSDGLDEALQPLHAGMLPKDRGIGIYTDTYVKLMKKRQHAVHELLQGSTRKCPEEPQIKLFKEYEENMLSNTRKYLRLLQDQAKHGKIDKHLYKFM